MTTKNFVVKNGLTTGNIILDASSSNITANVVVANLSVPGTANLGAIGNVKITGGTSGQLISTDGTGNLSFSTVSTSSISNGNSNVSIDTSGGNVTVGVNGSSNVVVISSTGGTVTGDWTVTGELNIGSASGGDIEGANWINANYFSGTLYTSAQPNITSVGTLSNLSVTGNASAGNILTNNLLYANGTAWTFSNYSNTNVAAYLPTYTGNVSANYFIGNGATLTSITGANVTGYVPLANAANTATSATTAGTVTTAAQPNITSVGTLSSLSVTGNVSANYFIGNGATLTSITGANVTGYVPLANAANTATSATTAGTVTTNAQPNITSVGTLNGLTGTGTINLTSASNVSLGSVGNVHITGGSPGYVLSTDGSGVLSWAAQTGGGSGNVTASPYVVKGTLSADQNLNTASDTIVAFNTKSFDPQNWLNTTSSLVTPTIAGYYKVTFFAWFTQGTSGVGSQYNIQIRKSSTSGGTTAISQSPIAGSNGQSLGVSDTVYMNGTTDYFAFSAYSSIAGQKLQYVNGTYFTVELIGSAAATSNIGNGYSNVNIETANANIQFGVNGTSNVAVISNVGVSITGNLNTSGNTTSTYFIGNGSSLTSITGGNVTGQVSNALVAGTVYSNAQPNITSVGTLSSLSVTGNVSANYFIGNGATLTNITGANVTGYVPLANAANTATTATSATTAGTVTTNAQPNITSVGTLSSLSVTGNVSANYFIGNGATLTNITGANVTGYVPLANAANTATTATSATTAGTVTTNAQPNITSVGTLTGLNVGGNIDVTGNINVTGNLNYSNVSNLVIGDPLIYIGANNSGNIVDLGIVASYNDGSYQHTGLARDHTDATWKLFTNLVNEPTTVIDWANASYADFKAGKIYASNANLGNLTTSNYFSGNGSLLTSITGANVTGYVPLANAANTATSATTAGTVTTNAQPNITSVGTLSSLSVTGNASANYFIGNGATLTSITGANVTGYVPLANAANTATSATTAGTVTTNAQPNITSVGTLTSLSVTGNVSANYFIGDGSQLTGLPASYSNTNVAAYLPTYTGNVRGNYFIGNGATLTNLTGANVTGYVPLANAANTATSATTAGTVTTNAQPNITSVGTLSSLSVTGNVSAGNILTNNLLYANGVAWSFGSTYSNTNVAAYLPTYTGNVSANYFIGNGATLTNITGANVTGYVPLANAANTATSATTAGTVTTNAQPNITSVGTLTNLTVSGNLTTGNLITSGTGGNISDANYVIANYFSGNGALLTSITGANVTGYVPLANVANSATTAGTVTTNAQPNITSVGTLTSIAVSGDATITGNLTVSGTTEYTNVTNLYVKDPIIELGGGVNGAPLTSNDGKDRGTLLHYYSSVVRDAFMGWDNSNAEFAFGSNVSVSSEVVTFNSFGNVRAGYYFGNGSQLTSLTGANVTGYVPLANAANTATSATTAGTVTTNAQPNITSVGTLSTLSVTGNVSANYFIGNGSTLTNITGANVTGYVPLANAANTATSATTAGTVTTNAQPNITSVGTLSSLSVTGNASANYFIGNGSTLTDITGANVTGYVPLANAANTATSATTAGTVTTNAQPNITSVGTLSSLSVTGNVSANYFIGDGSQLTGLPASYGNSNVANYLPTYTGNLSPGNLKTDNLLYANGTAWTFGGTPGGLNTYVQFNDSNSFGGSSQFTFDKGTNTLSVANITTGNGTGGNITGANYISASYLTGTLTTAAQPNITSLGTLSSLSVTSNVSAGNVLTNNLLYANGVAWSFSNYANTNVAAYLPTYTGNVSANYFIGNGATLTNITGANVTGYVPLANAANTATSATTAGTVTTAAQPNITSVGTLSNLTVSGDATITGNLTVSGTYTYANVTSFNVKDPIIEQGGNPNGTPLSSNDGKDRGQILHYYASGAIDAFMGWDNSNAEFGFGSNVSVSSEVVTWNNYGNIRAGYFIGNGATLTNITGANVTGYVPLANAANTATSATTAGTVTTAAQPNITSVGTLSNLSVSGNITTGNLVTTGTSGNISGANYILANYFVGNGALLTGLPASYANSNVANYLPTYTGNVAAGNLLTNNILYANGVAWTFSNYSNTNVAAYLPTYTGNVSAGNVKTDNLLYANGVAWSFGSTYSNANVAAYLPTYTGNLTAGNANISGSITASSIVTSGSSGNISGANYIVANYFSGNGSTLTSITGANVTGYVPLANAANTATSATTAGTVTTAAQPNITSVGTLTSLTSGLITATSGGIKVGNLQDPSGTNTIQLLNSNVSVTGNIVAGAGGSGNVTATYFIGNGSQLTGISGTYSNTNVAAYLPTYTGNLSPGNLKTDNLLYANGVAWSFGSTYSNANVASYLPTYTGNVSANYFIGNGATLTSITGANVTGYVPLANAANTATSATTAGTVTTNAQPNITSLGTLTSLTVSGNLTTGNLITSGTGGNISDANYVIANYFSGNGALLTSITGANVTGYVPLATAANTAGTVTTNAQPNITSVGTLSSLSVTGNVSANYLIGNGATLTNITGANVTGYVPLANAANTATSATTAGTVTTAAQPNITSVGTLSSLSVTGNVSANYFIGNGATLTNITGANVTGYVPLANVANSATTAGTVTTAAQPNITSVGTLTSLTVSGDSTITGNLTVSGTYTYANVTSFNVKDPIIEQGGNPNGSPLTTNDGKDRGQILHYYSSGAIDAFMGWDNSNAEFGFGSNVSVSSEVVTWNNYGNIRAGYFIGNGATLTNVNGANITGYVPLSTSANTAGTVTTNAQPNITSVGTLSSLSVTGNVSANYFIGNGATLTSITGANVTGYVPLANAANTATSATTAGTVTTNAQPNITSVGTLSSLSVTANASAGNVLTDNLLYANGTAWSFSNYSNTNVAAYLPTYTGNLSAANLTVTTSANLGSVSNVRISGGTNGYVLSTDGSGSLSWVAQTGGGGNVSYATVTIDNFTGNGVQTNFTLSVEPGDEKNITVNYNGALQLHSAYTLSGNVLTMSEAPSNGSFLEVTSITGLVAASNASFTTRSYTGDGSNVNFTVSSGTTVSSVLVTENGVLQTPTTDYTISGTTLTFTTAPATGVQIQIRELTTVTATASGSSYSNSNVASYLLTNTGNISANYFIGDGSQLTGLPASYANSNVASYLPTYTGNVGANYFVGNGATLGSVANVKITGGSSGQAIVTDGAGNLSFGTAGVPLGKTVALNMFLGF